MPDRYSRLRAVDLLSGRARGVGPALLRCAAAGLEPIYRAAVAARNGMFDRRWRRVHRAHRPVISFGNLTTGGTGKTPLILLAARALLECGHRPAILLRGYRMRRGEGPDEPQLLARALPGTPVAVEPDRAASARRLEAQEPHVDVLLLDDGFQHRRLARDLDLVLIDATNPFGFDRLLPRGLLREPPESLRRAHAVVVTHSEALDEAGERQLAARIVELHGREPIAWFAHRWAGVVSCDRRPVEADPRTPLVAFCGIGNPEPFHQEAAGRFRIVAHRTFPDHHAYRPADLRALQELAAQRGAEALITTEKDWVRLQPLLECSRPARPIWRAVLHLEAVRGGAALVQRVCQTAARGAGRPPNVSPQRPRTESHERSDRTD